jgi:putative transcriptional regulator
MSQLGREILEGLHETLAFAKGRPTKGRASLMVNGQEIDIRKLREQLGMTRDEFAQAFYFTKKTVQNWEQGIRQPKEHSLAYLRLIAADPKGVYQRLHPRKQRAL